MRNAAVAFGVLLGLLGLVWIGQGMGYIKGSFMTGSGFWEAMGFLCLGVGCFLLWLGLRRRRTA